MIELKEVTKEYSKGVAALNGINLKVDQGEFVFIVGDSGSGKSTLIRLILKELEQKGFLGGLPLSDGELLWCATEMNTKDEMDQLAEIVSNCLKCS